MPIIFPFTQTGATIAVVLFFALLIYLAGAAMFLEHKTKRYMGLRISMIFAGALLLYCEWCAVDIGFTLNPPKNATMKCVEK